MSNAVLPLVPELGSTGFLFIENRKLHALSVEKVLKYYTKFEIAALIIPPVQNLQIVLFHPVASI